MIAKARDSAGRRGGRRSREPVDIRLTVAFRFGDEPGERVTVMDDRHIPFVGSLFESRDKILRGFTRLLIKAGAQQPKVARELLPLLKLLRPTQRRERKKNPSKR